METRKCQNCHNEFTIEKEDFDFYEKINVPPPTWCPKCRLQRRYAWRNERKLYRRNCDKCKKSIVTFYSPNKPHQVYCTKCWWGDEWDPLSYGEDFNFSKPFFQQFRELQLRVPRIAVFNQNNINSEYTNHSGDCKNTYLSSCCFYDEDVLYSNWIMHSRNCVDCSYIYDGGEKLYECIDSRKSYQSQYCCLIENCVNCYYCYDCRNCTDCFMSSNLRNKKYVFRNKQLTRETYIKEINQCDLSSYLSRTKIITEFCNLYRKEFIHKYIASERNTNCTGCMLFNSKNAQQTFDSDSIEDSKYVYSAISLKSSMDLYHIGWGTELAYEIHGGRGYYNCQFCHHGWNNSDMMYSDSCHNSKNIFGCISVKSGEYVILNKRYSKEKYFELKNKIINHMKKTGEWGQYFPPSISPVCYNESQGNYYMPETKKRALELGWQWEDQIPGIFGKETISTKDLPDNIGDVDDNILQQILKCEECAKNYNIVPAEYVFYKQESLPIPRICPECRHVRRFDLRLPRKLWHRKCMNTGCNNEFDTSYAPERPEKVYCEACYNKAVY